MYKKEHESKAVLFGGPSRPLRRDHGGSTPAAKELTPAPAA
jgi:hypothetical protein